MAQFNPNTIKGFAWGVGVAVLAPVAVTALVTVGRPALRAAIKAGLLLYDQGREKMAEAGELWEDLVAEAQADLDEARGMAQEMAENQPDAPPAQAEQVAPSAPAVKDVA
jgi:hypothetical protein